MNYSVNVNLLNAPNAFVANIKGKRSTQRCICIPIDLNEMFSNENKVSLELIAFERKEVGKYGDTHSLKFSIGKEKYDAMTDEEKKAQKYMGDMKPFVTATTEPETAGEVSVEFDGNDKLPF
jgi:hypothetical protein